MMSARYSLLSIVLAIVLIAGGSDAIIGGERALQGEFPYVVSLRKNGELVCGGAIVDERHVVTAAECVMYPSFPNNITVVATGSVEKDGGQIHRIKSIVTYPQFNDYHDSSLYDIAIIVLTENITFNDNQKSAVLPNGPSPDGVTATLLGFGVTNERNDNSYGHLNKINTMIISNEECEHDDDTQFCTSFSHGTGACSRDLGGPLVYDGHLIGIASYTHGCGIRSDVAGYSNVSHLVPWIREIMAETYDSEDPFKTKFLSKLYRTWSAYRDMFGAYLAFRELPRRMLNLKWTSSTNNTEINL